MKTKTAALAAGLLLVMIGSGGWGSTAPPVLFEPRGGVIMAPRLADKLVGLETNRTLPVMVYFTDKGIRTQEDFNRAAAKRKAQFTEHALWRRAKVGRADMDFMDLPVSREHVQRIEALGARLRVHLNWFNAATFEMTREQVEQVSNLPFVRKMDLVVSFRRPLEPEVLEPELGSVSPPNEICALNYGPSYWQVRQINVPRCHDSSYTGRGVIVAMFDAGFGDHACFDSIRNSGRLIDQHDFYTNRDTTDWYSHGRGTWSEAGGFYSTRLIGPGYGATWAIYRTEVVAFERNIEEDYWAAALQRSDTLGVEVVSSSLGYFTFDSGQHSYTYQDMNGNTAICSRAAKHAANLGIIVCNAMGNSGPSAGSITAPADADSILSIGAVDSVGTIASFSSRGPTYDGRMKPEVCAKGVSDYWASSSSRTAFGTASGTSCSTPLVGGSCAIVLQVHPAWTPMQVRRALMMTASRHTNPDNNYGWGIIDVWAAIHYSQSAVEDDRIRVGKDRGLLLESRPNPTTGAATLSFSLARAGEISLAIYDASGRRIRALLSGPRGPGTYAARWDGRDEKGIEVPSGIYFYKLFALDRNEVEKVVVLR
jgi:serine protease AprX